MDESVAQEWPEGADFTPWDMSSRDALMRLSPLHNSALAAKDKLIIKPLVEALEYYANMGDNCKVAKDALASVKTDEITQGWCTCGHVQCMHDPDLGACTVAGCTCDQFKRKPASLKGGK